AYMTASSPEPHNRLIVVPAASIGSPANKEDMRATLRLSSPAWLALPSTTSSMLLGDTSGLRSISPLSTIAPRSSGRTSFNTPLYLPTGVRSASTITASLISHPSLYHRCNHKHLCLIFARDGQP